LGVEFELQFLAGRADPNDPALKAMKEAARQLGLDSGGRGRGSLTMDAGARWARPCHGARSMRASGMKVHLRMRLRAQP